MKIKATIIAFIVILGLLASNITPAQALPPLPSSFYGTVKVDGVNVPNNTVISAWINGVQYASAVVATYLGDSVYAIDVPGDDTDPSVPGLQGGVENDTIVFHIGSLIANQTGTWHTSTNIALNLTSSSSACYTLTLGHEGTGTDPIASPTTSTGCEPGKFVPGELISLNGALPAVGWHISGWSGTENNNSTASTNALTMPASNTSASVIYTVNPPVAPQLISPKKGSTTNTSKFTWKPVLNAVRYQIQVSRSSTFSPLLFSVSSTIPSYTRTGMKDGQYYWRVKAINSSGGIGNWSVAWFFKLDKTPPAVPILIKPANYTKVSGIPTYSWTTAAGAKYYIFECSRSSTFTTLTYKSGKLITTSYKPPIQAPGIYYWRVRAIDVAGNESKSAIWKVTVK